MLDYEFYRKYQGGMKKVPKPETSKRKIPKIEKPY